VAGTRTASCSIWAPAVRTVQLNAEKDRRTLRDRDPSTPSPEAQVGQVLGHDHPGFRIGDTGQLDMIALGTKD
jgi:hypothetical protein